MSWGMTSLEIPSLAPDENKFSPAGSLGNIKSVMGRNRDKKEPFVSCMANKKM